jgi:hypothetical protein
MTFLLFICSTMAMDGNGVQLFGIAVIGRDEVVPYCERDR